MWYIYMLNSRIVTRDDANYMQDALAATEKLEGPAAPQRSAPGQKPEYTSRSFICILNDIYINI